MWRTALIVVLVLGCTGFFIVRSAQPVAQSRLTSGMPDAEASPVASFGTRAVLWVVRSQVRFQRELTRRVRDLADGATMATTAALMVVSFLYGIFHAAGPGHGKAILTTYLLTHRQRMRRGLWMAGAASLCQGLVAVLLVCGLVALAGEAPRDTQSAVIWTERLSFGLVALVGALLGWRGARALGRLRWAGPSQAVGEAEHHHSHAHEGCGHVHMPAAHEINAGQTMRTMAGVILSIGIRPCSGAILVLAFAQIVGMLWAGIAAVGVMSLGTATAIASLAGMVVWFRGGVQALVGRSTRRWELAGQAVNLVGGLAILWIGCTLLAASFGPPHPFGF
ncbi:MAG TPA: high frequency lysogenization protein HflD [Alphaproteobacteria bacterium]|nr:high frequency lysogenization protein HflD [Alphaproteobacteria bacterium]